MPWSCSPPGIQSGLQLRGWTWTNSPLRKRRRPHLTPSPLRKRRRPHLTPSPLPESEGRTLPHPPSGDPKVARYPIAPPGIPRSCLAPSPSGNPKVVPRPIPPGIPTGFCHKARGCAAEALPRVKVKNINNPNGVVPNVHRVVLHVCALRGSWTYIPGGLLFRTREHDFIPPLFVAPPTGTNGTTPCGVGNAMGPGPGVAPGSAQPRAVCHNAFGVGGGEPRMDANWGY